MQVSPTFPGQPLNRFFNLMDDCRCRKKGFTLDMAHTLKAFRDIDFHACYNRTLNATFDDVPLHLNDLISERKTTDHTKDLLDVEALTKIPPNHR